MSTIKTTAATTTQTRPVKPQKWIYFQASIDFCGENVENLLEEISEAKIKFNELLSEFYKNNPNVVKTIEKLEAKNIKFNSFCIDYDSSDCGFEVYIPFENANYAEELKEYNARMCEIKKQTVKKKDKNATLNKLTKLLKNADQDKVEKILDILK